MHINEHNNFRKSKAYLIFISKFRMLEEYAYLSIIHFCFETSPTVSLIFQTSLTTQICCFFDERFAVFF